MSKQQVLIVLLGLVLTLTGCSGNRSLTQSFMRENASLGHIDRIAVMPFEGGNDAARIRELTTTQILAAGLFDVVDKGRVDNFLQREAIPPNAPLDEFTIKRLGETIKVKAILRGSVTQETASRGSAKFPEMIMTLRLIDTETGLLLWQASGRGSGYSLSDRLFGFAPKDRFEVTLDLLNALFASMR